ncbi:hypothetical protein BX600DRAFT_100529 [Xylariales sp. PMI_506]|nr:hypothetical protein BX600DRAFT_100529 [Xylariales sp. PMI_506]
MLVPRSCFMQPAVVVSNSTYEHSYPLYTLSTVHLFTYRFSMLSNYKMRLLDRANIL